MSEKKTTSKKVHTLTLEDQTKLAQANVKKMEQGKIEVMKVVEGVQGAEKLAELIERGKKNGKLSSSELMDVLENLDLESDQMDKIYDTLENLGIMPDQIENAGKAAKILDRLDKRKNEGLTTPKQIRYLESKGFQHVGTWQFHTAKNLIDRIAGNGWKIPNDIVPQEYKGA